MGRNRLRKVFLPLLLLIQQSIYQSLAEETHQNEMIGSNFAELIQHISKQDARISKIEAHGETQEHEMSNLKATVSEDKKKIQFLENRVALLERPTEGDRRLIKRPVRLLPARIL